jgi:hypothetical protein
MDVLSNPKFTIVVKMQKASTKIKMMDCCVSNFACVSETFVFPWGRLRPKRSYAAGFTDTLSRSHYQKSLKTKLTDY